MFATNIRQYSARIDIAEQIKAGPEFLQQYFENQNCNIIQTPSLTKKCLSYNSIEWKKYLSCNFIQIHKKESYENGMTGSIFSIQFNYMLNIFSIQWQCMVNILCSRTNYDSDYQFDLM